MRDNHSYPRGHEFGGDVRSTTETAELLRDAELALKIARGCVEGWRATSPDVPPAAAVRHAYQAHEALHEASRAINELIETFRAEVAGHLAVPACDVDVPAPR